MAEEETGLQTEENTGQTDSQTDTGTPEKKEETIDWEKRYKNLQSDSTKTHQRLADLEATSEQSQQTATATEETEQEYPEGESFVDRKTVGQMIKTAVSEAVQGVRMQTADSYFRRTYPELVKHENAISGIMRSPTDSKMLKKGVSAEERIDSAVKEFQALTEEAVTEAKTQADTEAKEREEKNRKAAGLGSATTAPAKSEEGKSDAEELADRKARLARKRNLA